MWRPMRADDLPAVCAISDAVHGDFTEDHAIYAERLALYPDGCFALDGRNGLVGYLISHHWHRDRPAKLNACVGQLPADSDGYYLHDVALLPDARGIGAGTAALAQVVAQARAAGFADITLMAVNGADRYWATQGFGRIEKQGSASYGSGSVLMRLVL